jgi:hypothetical protein
MAEQADELLRRLADQVARARLLSRCGLGNFRLGLRLASDAGGEEQGRGEDETAHGRLMGAVGRSGNVARR